MIIRINSLFAFVLLLAFTSCGRKTITVEKTDELGFRTVYTVNAETELKEGQMQLFDDKGTLLETANYANDKLNGKRIIFADNGDSSIVETYVDGVFSGPYRSFHTGGQQVKLSGNYVDNVMSGLWYKYHLNGQLAEEVTFANNEENGPFKEWFENGNLAAEGSYLNGDNEHGRLRVYNEDGSLNRVMDCDEGVCRSVWREDYDTPPPPRQLPN